MSTAYVVINTIPSRPQAGVEVRDLPVGAGYRGAELPPGVDPELLDRLIDSGMVRECARVAPLYDTFALFI